MIEETNESLRAIEGLRRDADEKLRRNPEQGIVDRIRFVIEEWTRALDVEIAFDDLDRLDFDLCSTVQKIVDALGDGGDDPALDETGDRQET